MLHPYIKLKNSKIQGRGLFAIKDIPKGAVLWRFKDVRIYTKEQFDTFSKKFQDILEHYAYEDIHGNLVYCLDNAKYWNHSCDPNACGLGQVDVAIKDIKKGKEITYDYAIFMPKWFEPFKCNCGSKNCRKIIKKLNEDNKIIKRLVKTTRDAIKLIPNIKQPLLIKDEKKNIKPLLVELKQIAA